MSLLIFWLGAAAGGTNAPATVAASTGAAGTASASLKPTATLASATGAAADALARPGSRALAATAAATGAAADAATRPGEYGTAAVAAGTGSGVDASASIAPRAGLAAGTGDASAGLIPAPVWTTPGDGVPMNPQPELKFTIPFSGGDQHFWMELDTAATFDTGDLQVIRSDVDQTGWDFWNGAGWEAVPVDGVAVAYIGNEGRYTVQADLDGATWYRRVRAGT